MDPLQSAMKGDVDFFKEANPATYIEAKGETGESVLAVAAMWGYLSCCQEIFRRCPSLIYHRDINGLTALHLATLNSNHEIFKFFIDSAITKIEVAEDSQSCGDGGKKLLTMVSFSGASLLHCAVQGKDIQTVKLLVELDADHELLRIIDHSGNTALHFAMETMNISIIKLLLVEGATFNCFPNKDGQTPLLLATARPNGVGIQKLLLKWHPSQCEIPFGEKCWTVLHHATSRANLNAINDITWFYPDFFKLLDKNGQNFIHVAAKKGNIVVMKYILKIYNIPDQYFNVQDINGCTPLHIAAAEENASMVLPLLYDSRVDKLLVNIEGLRALDMIKFDYDEERAGISGVMNEKEINDQTDLDLLVNAVIGTVSFTSGISSPGGYITDGSNKGTALLATKLSYKMFLVSNSIALLLSLHAVFRIFCAKRLLKEKDTHYHLSVSTYCTLGGIFAMVVAFITVSYAVLAVANEFAIIVCVLCCCFLACALRATWQMVVPENESRVRM